MKRISLISSALALGVLAPLTASAEPGIVYIPTDAVTLRPTSVAPCTSAVNSALGCGGAASEVEEPPFAGAADLTTAMQAGLAAYDVTVTNTRPPEYISYMMVLASDEPLDPESGAYESFTCAFGGINCSARPRNDIVSTSGTTENCIDPDVVHAAMYAFGRNSGLEGIADATDWMNYPPDYTTPPTGFQDVCADRVQQMGFNDKGEQIVLPLECTSLDHTVCEGDPVQQNSHQELLLSYGEPLEDTDPPVLENITPEDGTVLMAVDGAATLAIDVDITDADVVVGARWTIESEALAELVEGGVFTICTNDVCNENWDDAAPLKPTDSDWASPVGLNFPPGEYTITLEAADYHGNVAEPVVFTVTIMGEESADSSGDGGATGNDDDSATSGQFTTGADGSGGSGGGSAADGGDEESGCSCKTSTPTNGGAALMLLGLMGLGAMRRRW